MNQPGCSFVQAKVDRTPAYEGRKKVRRPNQVLSKTGIIRKDKRTNKVHYL